MNTLVIYDISDDDLRSRVAQTCMDYGLVRIQKSAFIGRIDSQKRKGLVRILERLIKSQNDNIQIFVICDADIRLRKILGFSMYGDKEGDTVFFK
jgi:CRISPR-associated protein Cas2